MQLRVLKKTLVIAVLILVSCLISNAQTIHKFNPGDTLVVGDTAIVGIDVHTYRIIRQTGVTTNQLVAQKTLLIEGLEKENDKLSSIINSKNKRIDILQDDILRKDLAITNMVAESKRTTDEVIGGLEGIKEELSSPKPFYASKDFWMGIGVGVLVGILIIN